MPERRAEAVSDYSQAIRLRLDDFESWKARGLAKGLERHEGHVLDRAEPFGNEKVGDDVVDVERVDEGLRARPELLVAPPGFLVLGQNVDVPPRQLRSQPDVLPPAADC